MPKLEIVFGEDLGNIKMPIQLTSLLNDYCLKTHRTKSDVVRSALARWLHADMETILAHDRVGQLENNGHDGADQSASEREAVEKAQKLREIMMGP